MIYYILFLLFCACSNPQQSEDEKIRRQNLRGEFIYRNHDEFYYTIPLPKHRVRQPYPWEMAKPSEPLEKVDAKKRTS